MKRTWSLLTDRKSLQSRLLGLLMLMVMLVWLGAGVLTWVDTSDELDELLDGHLAQSAALLVVQQADRGPLAGAEGDEDGEHVDDAPSLHKYAPSVAFQVFHEGRLILRSNNAGSTPMSARQRGFDTVRMSDRSQWRVFAAQGSRGDVQVYVAEKMASRRSILWAVLSGVLMPMLLAMPLLALRSFVAKTPS